MLSKHQISIFLFIFLERFLLFSVSSDDTVIKGVLLGVVCPVGRGHAAVRVQQDAETAHDEQRQEYEQQQHEDKRGFLFQRQVGRHMMPPSRRGQRAAEEALGHPGHVHARSSGLQLSVF